MSFRLAKFVGVSIGKAGRRVTLRSAVSSVSMRAPPILFSSPRVRLRSGRFSAQPLPSPTRVASADQAISASIKHQIEFGSERARDASLNVASGGWTLKGFFFRFIRAIFVIAATLVLSGIFFLGYGVLTRTSRY